MGEVGIESTIKEESRQLKENVKTLSLDPNQANIMIDLLHQFEVP